MEWHDFRKEKPIKNDCYLIKTKVLVVSTHYQYRVDTWLETWKSWMDANPKNVVAWAELPKCDIT